MLGLKEGQLESLLKKEMNHVKEIELVSITKKAPAIEALDVFNAAKKLNKDRIYWHSAEDNFTIVGVGRSNKIVANSNRYETTEQIWNELLNKAIIHNPFKKAGTGLMAIGGLAFDPKKDKTSLWENYSDSEFSIPEFVYVKAGNESYITINLRMSESNGMTEMEEYMRFLEEQLVNTSASYCTETPTKIVSRVEVSPYEWKEMITRAKEEFKTSIMSKVVLARELRLQLSSKANIGTILQALKTQQPTSYIFAFEHGEDCFIGATPERLIKMEQQVLLSTCLAGTAPRGQSVEEDEKLRKGLLDDCKNRQEHDFVVQMIHQSIRPYTDNITIPEVPVVLPLKNMQHLYTPVTATLKDDYSIFNIIEKLHPTPALGGSPKVEALQFIRENERLDRGWYGAPVGWLDSNQNGEFAVAIRSGLIKGDKAHLFAGCGIVADSDPEEEYEETNMKFTPMLSALGG